MTALPRPHSPQPASHRHPGADRRLALRQGLAALALAAGIGPLASLPALAADSPAQQAALSSFQLARTGDESQIPGAVEKLQALVQAEPGQPLWLAYAGAATALQARTTFAPWKKMRYTEDGLAQIDKALALLPGTPPGALHNGVPLPLEVKITAASTFLALPSMFNRGERGRRLLEEVQKDPGYGGTPAGFQEVVRQLAAKGVR